MKTILLTFDIEEFPAREFKIPMSIEEAYKIGYEGTKKLLEIVKKNKIPITCFVTYEFAKKYKKIIKEFESLGCEIASHGVNHDHRYNKMPEKESLKYLKKSLQGLRTLGFKTQGFRAPQMSHPSYEIIKKSGFKYDSSMHPTWIPGYYNNFFKKRAVTKINDITLIPLSVCPIIHLPMAWLWFRNFGLLYEKILTILNFIDMDFTNIYIHPWELVNIDTKLNRKYMPRITIRKSGDLFSTKIDKYIKWCKYKDYKFLTISDYIKNETN